MWFNVGLIIYPIEVLNATLRKNSHKKNNYGNMINHWWNLVWMYVLCNSDSCVIKMIEMLSLI